MRAGPPQLALMLVGFVAVAVVSLAALEGLQPDTELVIGCKNFTESRFLAWLVATAVSDRTDLRCQVRELGSTSLCYDALQAGAIDLYPEYTGTLLVEIWKGEALADRDASRVRASQLAEEHGLALLSPFGFDNTYVLAVNPAVAKRLRLERISQLADHRELRGGFPSEFYERSDGYPGLARRYGLKFSNSPVDLAPGHMYAAAQRGQVDFISAFSTDGRIDAFGLTTLEDDRRFFPCYEAAILIRKSALARWPELSSVLAELGGSLDEGTMRSLNGRMDLEGVPPRQAAAEFWALFPQRDERP